MLSQSAERQGSLVTESPREGELEGGEEGEGSEDSTEEVDESDTEISAEDTDHVEEEIAESAHSRKDGTGNSNSNNNRTKNQGGGGGRGLGVPPKVPPGAGQNKEGAGSDVVAASVVNVGFDL